jgi:hypothetical protein
MVCVCVLGGIGTGGYVKGKERVPAGEQLMQRHGGWERDKTQQGSVGRGGGRRKDEVRVVVVVVRIQDPEGHGEQL